MTMTDSSSPADQAQQPEAQTLSNYVALRPLRFGDETVQPGQRVPLDSFRDYAKLLREGSIAVAADPAGQAAAQLATGTAGGLPVTQQQPQQSNAKQFLEMGTGPAYFVSQDGAVSKVMVLSFHSADKDDAEALDIPEGSIVAEATFEHDSPSDSPSVVPLSSLLPVQPTERLIEDLQAAADQEQQAQAPADPAAAAELDQTKKELAFKTLLLDAVTTEGTELPDYVPTHAKGVLHKSRVNTLEGLVKLAAGPDGVGNLTQLNGFADKSARTLVNLLVTHEALPAESAVTEGA